MSRKPQLFDSGKMIDDLYVRALSPLAKLFYFLLLALANKGGDGYLRFGENMLSWEDAARELGFAGDVENARAEMLKMRLVQEDGVGIFIPEIRAAALLRAKRKRAGKTGGERTTLRRPDVCLSKKRLLAGGNVIALENASISRQIDLPFAGQGGQAAVQKSPRTPKNNKYIYILSQKVFIGDRGTSDNPAWQTFSNFTLWKRDYKTIQAQFCLSEDRFDQILEQHDRFLDARPEYAANWLGALIGYLRKISVESEVSTVAA